MRYRIVIPDLVSIETDSKKLKSFYLLRNIDYFGNSKQELKLNYKISTTDRINMPYDYDFKNSNYQVKNNIWTYGLNKFGLDFSFQYDYFKKMFICSRMLNKLPIRINWTHPIGDYVADLINLELFLNKIIIFNGVAFRQNGEIHVFCAPSLNGKSTFLKKNEGKIDEIISDDYVVLDLINRKIAVTPLLGEKKNKLFKSWYSVEKINLIINSTNDDARVVCTISEFVKMSAMKFSDNVFIKNLIFYYHLENTIENILHEMELSGIFEITNIQNYDYKQLRRN